MRRDGDDGFFSTGLEALDAVLQGVMAGDNIVFQVDAIEDYVPFVRPFCVEANREGRELIYFRFAEHEPLLPAGVEAHVYHLHPEDNFEKFLIEIHLVIERHGFGACYVFDCLSELAVDWYSDRMLANFFLLTCPYLYQVETATYFALLRNRHAPDAAASIHATAQVVIDVFRHDDRLYLYPLKVWQRLSPTMYTLHAWVGDDFTPVTRSDTIAEILSSVPQPWLDPTLGRPDLWTRTFIRAREIVEEGGTGSPEARELVDHLLRMVMSRDPRFLALAEKYVDMPDLLEIGGRMIGSGLIGGKSAGMVLARAVLLKADPSWRGKLEKHDSFYIGSDVFYTFLVRNGLWHDFRKERDPAKVLARSKDARERIMAGGFTDETLAQFSAMLDYFGQSPIIVRSSSLLEDAYGNAFSGKYDSVFCVNQGTPRERLVEFVEAVKTVYASTMSGEALEYRIKRKLFDRDEQMALLVMRVSGAFRGKLYYPQLAGVGFSFNPYVWAPDIDPDQGFLRLVYGLGTRAVERSGDDYTRLVALNAWSRRPDAASDDAGKYSQKKVDALDLGRNAHVTVPLEEVLAGREDELRLFAARDEALIARARQHGAEPAFPWMLDFDRVFGDTRFIDDMKAMLLGLHAAYECPVDIEFTANLAEDGEFRINLLQCRPFQARGDRQALAAAPAVAPGAALLRTKGPLIGTSRAYELDRLIYVVPSEYSALGTSDRHAVARLIGKLVHAGKGEEERRIMLVGPGRWGTTTPALGVPVKFAEINAVSIICELALMHAGLVPDISLGSHFFNDLVETDMMYCAVFPEKEGHRIGEAAIMGLPDALESLVPGAGRWGKVVRAVERAEGSRAIRVYMNSITQEGICYME